MDHVSKYEPGSTSAFTKGGCKCDACSLGWRRYQKRYRLDVARQGLRSVPADDPRARLMELLAAGFSIESVALGAGLRGSAVHHLLTRQTGRVARPTAVALMGCSFGDVLAAVPDNGYVPSLGARRRMHALVALGWPVWQQAGASKKVAATLHGIRAYDRVRASTHRLMVGIYDELAMEPGPSAISRRRAAEAGWAPPLAWDDDEIDDPAAGPAVTVHGVGAAYLDPDVLAEVERLTAAGLSAAEVAVRLDTTPRRVQRMRSRARAAVAA